MPFTEATGLLLLDALTAMNTRLDAIGHLIAGVGVGVFAVAILLLVVIFFQGVGRRNV